MLNFKRHPENPIVVPGLYCWRRAVVFNPGVLLDEDGKFTMYERAAGQLRPFYCSVGMLESEDGAHFTHASPAATVCRSTKRAWKSRPALTPRT